MELLQLTHVSWSESLLEELNSMRKASHLCDVRILLEHDQLLLAHSSILSASSPFFKSLLDGVDEPEIDLGDFPGEIIKQVINFIYTGRTLVSSAEIDLFHAVVDALHISVLSDLVKQVSCCDLNVSKSHVKDTRSDLSASSSAKHSKIRNDNDELKLNQVDQDFWVQERHYVRKDKITNKNENSSHMISLLNPGIKPEGEDSSEQLLIGQPVTSETVPSVQETVKTFYMIEDSDPSAFVRETQMSRARQTLPNVLVYGGSEENTLTEDGGVFTSPVIFIPKHVLFGPYKGVLINEPKQSRFCWKIYNNDGTHCWLDGTDESTANWMRYVNHTCNEQHQNLEAIQHAGQLYFRTTRDLPPNTELLISHTDQYPTLESEVIADITEASAGKAVPNIPYTCKECNVAYSSDILYYKHMRSKHGQAMPLEVYLKIQKERGMNLDPVTTQKAEFSNPEIEIHDESDHVKCGDDPSQMEQVESDEKGKNMTREQDLKGKTEASEKEKLRRTDENELKIYTCSVCSRSFKKVAYLKQHEDVHVDEKPYRCPKCGKNFVRQTAYENHLKQHDVKRKHVCSVCGRGFLHARPLEIHLRRHTGERPFKCPVCGRGFTDIGNLDRHKRLHTGEKPYQCSTCGKSFTQSGHLREHMRHHTGDKPFVCSVCGQAFTNNSNLQAHTRIHTGERPFVCNFCGKCYRDAAYLKSHKRIHTGEKPYMCLDCGMAFADNSKMRFHQRQKHQAGLTRLRKPKIERKSILIDN